MELKRTVPPIVDENVKKVQERLNYIRGSWPYLEIDGKFGPMTEKAVIAYQKSRKINPASGVVKDDTFNKLMNERYSIITSAKPETKIHAQPIQNNGDTIKQAYDVASFSVNQLYGIYGTVDESEKGMAFIFNEWTNSLAKQEERIIRRLNKIPANKPMRARNILKHIKKCEEFFAEANRYGISTATRVFSKNLTKEEGIKYIKSLADIISDSSVTKTVKAVSKTLGSVKEFLQPVFKFLNKIPGLQYLSVIEKIVQGTYALFHFDFDEAFVLYLDGLRLLLEQIIVDAVVAAAVAAGGWIALVIALAVIVVVFLVDYFLFNDDPENSWLPTTHLTTEVKPMINNFSTKLGEWEIQKIQNGWLGSKI